jgi:U3 small nucleolar RNA-associated protein 23
MRVTRHKAFKRALRFYKAAFDFVDPYHVLLGPCFLPLCAKGKVNIKDDLSLLLSGRVTPMVTSCVMCHLRKNGRKDPESLILGKQCYRLKCGHDEKNPLPSEECMISQLGKDNPRHFIIAAQEDSVKMKARVIAGTPVLSLHGKTLMLESPSQESREAAQHRELKRRLPKLSEVMDESLSSDDETGSDMNRLNDKALRKRKKRKIKGANPLSCLTKKTKIHQIEQGEGKKRVRSRRNRESLDVACSN